MAICTARRVIVFSMASESLVEVLGEFFLSSRAIVIRERERKREGKAREKNDTAKRNESEGKGKVRNDVK